MKVKNFVALMATVAVLMTIAGPLRAAVTDAQIVSSVQNTYVFKTFLQGDDIKIVSKNGVVTLTGVVANHARKSLAKNTVEALPGVKSVNNNLTVKGAEPTPNSDAWVKDNVEITLELHRGANDNRIDVSVHDGIVTLRGEAKNQAKRELATTYAEDIDGVKDVNNQMTVAGGTAASNAADYVDDASITAQVMYALATHRSTSVLKTKVETKDGVVTLTGTAKNQAERTLATLLANDINGVQSVRNRMTIE